MGSAPVSGGSCTTSIYPVCPDYPMQVTLLSGVSGGYHIQTRCTGPEDHAGYPAIWCVRRIPYTDYPAGALVRRILGHPEIYPSISVVSGGSQVTLRSIHLYLLCPEDPRSPCDVSFMGSAPVSGGSCTGSSCVCVYIVSGGSILLCMCIHLCPEDPACLGSSCVSCIAIYTCVRRILDIAPVSGGSYTWDPHVFVYLCPEDPAWILLCVRRILHVIFLGTEL